MQLVLLPGVQCTSPKKPTAREIKKVELEVKKYNTLLESLARKPEELIVPYEFEIITANFSGLTGRTFTPTSEMVFGPGPSPRYPAGDNYSCHFKVEAFTPSSTPSELTPIRFIDFIGWPHLEAGDKIRAYFNLAEEKAKKFVVKNDYGVSSAEYSRINLGVTPSYAQPSVENIFVLVERKANERERAIKIEKLGKNLETVACWTG